MTLLEIPNFASLFSFEQRVSALETKMSEYKQTSQFADVVSSIPAIVDNYLASKMKDAVDVAIQLQLNKLIEEAQAENEEFLKQIDSNMKAIIKEQLKLKSPRSCQRLRTASLSELELKKILIDKMEENKSINRSDIQKNLYNALVESYNFDKDIISSYGDVVTLKRGRDDQDKDEDPSVGSNRGSKRRRSGKEAESSKEPTHKESKSTSSSKGASRSQPKSSGKSAQAEEHSQKVDDLEEHSHQEFNTGDDDVIPVQETLDDASQWNIPTTGIQSSFNDFLATPIDFSAFIMNRLKIENLTQDVLTGPTYDLMKDMCKSVVELEYHLEEVFKATNDQLDWHNPEGRQHPHDLSKPLPLILNARGRQVIPFDHFINNDLKYMKEGSLSQRYTTSITKKKDADYSHVKWIKDKTRRIVIQERVEDLQLGVKSYQKKINLSRPDTYRSDLRKMTPYTAYPNIQGIINQDDMNRNRVMRTKELHKFSDGTLNYVRTALNDIAIGIQMEYLPKRK
ncbi:hypothetical protein Tco_1098149 [Tanacetum coccineum]